MSVNRIGGSNRYQVRVYNPHGGKEYRKIVTGKRAADAHETAIKTKFTRGTIVDPHAGKMLFGEYAAAAIGARKLTPNTRARYVRDISKMHTYWGHLPLRAIRHSDALTLTAAIRDEFTGQGAETVLVLARSIINQALRDGLLDRDPFVGVKILRGAVSKPRLEATWGEVVQVLAAAPLIRAAMLPAVLAGCGLRSGELAGLDLPSVDWLRKTITVTQQMQTMTDAKARSAGLEHGGPYMRPPKNKASQGRVIPVAQWTLDLLAAWLVDHPAATVALPWDAPDSCDVREFELIFAGSAPGAMSVALRVQAQKFGADWSAHDLRHLYVTTLEQSGVPMRTIQYVAGHSPVGVTGGYSHVQPHTLEMVRRVINDVWVAACEENSGPVDALLTHFQPLR